MKKRYAFLSTFFMCLVLAGCKNNVIKSLSNDLGFVAEGEFEKGSQLVVKQVQEVTNEQRNLISEKELCVDYNLLAYDISIQKEDTKIQPNNKVKISLDFPNNSKYGYSVFHFKTSTDMEVLKAIVANNKLSFETTSFSLFIIGENIPEEYNYTISYDLDGGNFLEGETVPTSYCNTSEFPLTLPIPSKEGYDFKEWKNSYNVAMTKITEKTRGDLVLKAYWEEKEEPTYTIDESKGIVTFGTYPQTIVKDELIINSLNNLISTKPEQNIGKGWNSFGFYSNNVVSDYAWYKDVEYVGNKYRAICINSWRLYVTESETSRGEWFGSTESNQMGNGVELDKVYWFKFEPIKWRILTKEKDKALLMCDSPVYAMQYQHISEEGTPCDYSKSDIRKWLNSSFYELAFGTKQKNTILDTLVDNSIRSADAKSETYNWNKGANGTPCENTIDKVFLPSVYELTNADYGFNEDPTTFKYKDFRRGMWWTDYTKYLGARVMNVAINTPNCEWWTRSPAYNCKDNVKNVSIILTSAAQDLRAYGNVVSSTHYGVVPTLWMSL